MYHLNYYHSIFNVCYTRIFGTIFNEFKYWISVRYLSSGLLEIFRFFTVLLKNSWKISGTFLSFEIIFPFAISVINLTLFGKRGTFFVFFCEFYFRSKRDTYVRGYPTVPAQKPWTFLRENLQKIIKDLFLSTKKSRIRIFCAI